MTKWYYVVEHTGRFSNPFFDTRHAAVGFEVVLSMLMPSHDVTVTPMRECVDCSMPADGPEGSTLCSGCFLRINGGA